MKASFYLLFQQKRRGWGLKVRCTERTPTVQPGEVSLYTTVELPDALFRKPQLRASITVPSDKVTPMTVDAEVAENIAAEISKQLGIEVQIKVESP